MVVTQPQMTFLRKNVAQKKNIERLLKYACVCCSKLVYSISMSFIIILMLGPTTWKVDQRNMAMAEQMNSLIFNEMHFVQLQKDH